MCQFFSFSVCKGNPPLKVGVLLTASGFRSLKRLLRHAHHGMTRTPLYISIGSPAKTEKLSGTFHQQNIKLPRPSAPFIYGSAILF